MICWRKVVVVGGGQMSIGCWGELWGLRHLQRAVAVGGPIPENLNLANLKLLKLYVGNYSVSINRCINLE